MCAFSLQSGALSSEPSLRMRLVDTTDLPARPEGTATESYVVTEAPRYGTTVLEPQPRPRAMPLPAPAARTRRLVSLDAFRGLAIGGMLLVNNKELGPWTPAELTHAGWSGGVHLADMVYPWFLLIVGVAIPFSSRRGLWRWRYALEVLKRSAILVLLGCLINSSYARHPLFDLGVLQLIGFAYLGAALLYWVPMRWRLALAGGFLAAHWALVRFLPIPGSGAGMFTEGQNAIAYLNRAYLGRWGLANLPAVLPTTALVLIGTAMGDLLRSELVGPRGKVRLLLVTGLALCLAGWLWRLSLPFSKSLWTASYVLLAAGWGSVVLASLYFITDVRQRRAWAFPLGVMGANAITAFVAPILVNIHVLGEWGWRLSNGKFVPLHDAWLGFFLRHAGAGPGGLLYTVSYLLAWWLVLFYMYRTRVFFRV